MKKKIDIILCMLAIFALASCSLSEEDDVFGTSSANRMAAALKADMDILTGAKNGWLMEYFPFATQDIGGYNVLVSFAEDGKTTVSSELYPSDESVTSLYSLKQSAGPVLTFDSYNEIMHLFSEPLDGYGSDFEFTIMSATSQEIILSGKKTNSKIIMTPIPENVNWVTYLDKLGDNISVLEDAPSTRMIVKDKEYAVTLINRTISLVDDNGKTIQVAFIYTTNGIKLRQPLTVNGQSTQEFVLAEGGKDLTAVGADITLPYPTLFEQLCKPAIAWNFGIAANTMSPALFTLANTAKQRIMSGENELITGMHIGASMLYPDDPSPYAIIFDSFTGARYWYIVYGYESTPVEGTDDQLNIVITAEGLNVDYYGKYLDATVKYIGDNSPYRVTNNNTRPTTVTYTSVKNPDAWFIIGK